ncbi:uncharacterized protein [Apostichopus japonicus]|uniref:uncharacterized protein isoform X2 n=1 Tax=Stichopus japonicus TaxID=307972 RepID=UPI003AB918D5
MVAVNCCISPLLVSTGSIRLSFKLGDESSLKNVDGLQDVRRLGMCTCYWPISTSRITYSQYSFIRFHWFILFLLISGCQQILEANMSRNTIPKIPFHSEEGKKILEEAASQPLLIKMFKKQQNNSFCGIHSCAMVMSAQHLGKGKSTPELPESVVEIPYTESNMFDYKETTEALSFEDADTKGTTLDELNNLFLAHGKKVHCTYAAESNLEDFRAAASEALQNSNSSSGVIVNYDEYQLEQDEIVHGHFSPIAGFHKEKDMVLLLDTELQTTDVWVGVKDLFDAMNTIDSASQKSRGWIVLL